MSKIKKALAIIIFLLSLPLSACQINNAPPSNNLANKNNNPYQSYFLLDQTQLTANPKLGQDIFQVLITQFPQANDLTDLIAKHQDIFSPIYHFILTQKSDQTTDYTLVIATTQDISQDTNQLSVPNKYYLNRNPAWITISTTQNPPPINLDSPDSFLTIFSINPYLDIENHSDQPADQLSVAIIKSALQDIARHPPLHFYYQDDQIIINFPEQSNNFTADLNYQIPPSSPANTPIKYLINQLLIDNYFQPDDLILTDVKLININYLDHNYTLYFQYQDQTNSQKIFTQLTSRLANQKIYSPEIKTLPDHTATTINSAQDTNVTLEINNNQIKYQNTQNQNVTLSLADQFIIISTTTVKSEPNLDHQIISWPLLISYFPILEPIHNIHQIEYRLDDKKLIGQIK
ncbi:MAG: hypothetical protein WC570_05240 [Patescibacteria group bacterium]